MDNPSTWNVLYGKTKAARRRHGNLIGRKTELGIKILCASYTARLTRNRVSGIVEGLCHTAGILRSHQIFATMSSDELKKSVAKRLLVLQRSINLIQFIRLQIQHFISAFCFFMGNLL